MNKSQSRRKFLRNTASFVSANALLHAGLPAGGSWAADDETKPNILWITSEDNGPHLGSYGDTYATTQNLDALAARGSIYLNAWSNAPVCAPARTTIISGVYPPCTGSEHMRSTTCLPASMKMFPVFLRQAGYYCTNNSKEDYNLDKTGKVWDDSGKKAHWKNREPGQPFFAVFNCTVTHESQIRKRPHKQVHDPAKVPIPAYHPDTPEVRQDWAQYYDKLTELDDFAGDLLKELEKDGLADNTIVFYYGDHGPGMPRNKRWPYNSGLRVPLIVHFPEKYKHLAPQGYSPGCQSDRLVSFVDLAPSVLSLAGIQPPEYMQGKAIAGKYEAPAKEYEFGFRGRMDERYDMVRSVRDQRYIYIRNYMPHRIYGQYLAYMFQTPTTQVWKAMYDQGRLEPPQTYFWEPKPPEELYDLNTDPDEVKNLAASPEHRETLNRLRNALRDQCLLIHDVGFLPEDEIHRRAGDRTPYEMGHDPSVYPMEKILAAAEQASLPSSGSRKLSDLLKDDDSAVRYWAAMGILIGGANAVAGHGKDLYSLLNDPAPSVRVPAAEALGRYGSSDDKKKAIDSLLELSNQDNYGPYVAVAALNALDMIEDLPPQALEAIQQLPQENPNIKPRVVNYVSRLVKWFW